MQVCRNDVMFLIFQSFYFFVGFQFHQTGVLGGGEFKTGQKYCLCSKKKVKQKWCRDQESNLGHCGHNAM